MRSGEKAKKENFGGIKYKKLKNISLEQTRKRYFLPVLIQAQHESVSDSSSGK
jgi:hypothetical protein